MQEISDSAIEAIEVSNHADSHITHSFHLTAGYGIDENGEIIQDHRDELIANLKQNILDVIIINELTCIFDNIVKVNIGRASGQDPQLFKTACQEILNSINYESVEI